MIKKIIFCIKQVLNLGAVAIVLDIVTPLKPYSLYVSLGLFLCFSFSLLLHFVPASNTWLKSKHPDKWYAPIGTLLFIGFIVMMGLYIAGKKSPDERGILSDHFEAIEGLQRRFGMIKDDVQEIAERTSVIDEKMDTLKLEVSDNPQKELSNLGVVWSPDSFDEAIRTYDLKTISLFLDGGISPTDNVVQGHGGILWLMRQDNPQKYQVFNLLLSKGLDTDIKPRDYGYTKMTVRDRMAKDPGLLELMIKHGLSRKEGITYCNKAIGDIEKVYAHPCYKWLTAEEIPEKKRKEVVNSVVGPLDPYINNSIRMLRINGDHEMADSRERMHTYPLYKTICKNTIEMNRKTETKRKEDLQAFSALKKSLRG